MKNLSQYLLHFLFIVLILLPTKGFADNVAPGAASGFSATIVNGKVLLKFKESSASDLDGYLVLRKQEVGYAAPTLINGVDYKVATKFIVDTPWEQWEVVSNDNNRNEQLLLDDGSFTYLVYMRDKSKNYSQPSRIVVNNYDKWTDNDLAVNLLVVTGGTLHINGNRKLTFLNDGALAGFGGALSNNGLIQVTKRIQVPVGVAMFNAGGTIEVKAGGELTVEGSFKSLYQSNVVSVEKSGKLVVAAGGSYILDQGRLVLKSGATMLVSGMVEWLPNSGGISNEGASLSFTAGSRFNLRTNVRFPQATWQEGSTFAYYGDWY
ncbi:hypothetical protein GCM10028895_08890 [Pontibacter rugosus]